MDYQVWIKDEFVDTWKRGDCGDLEAAKRIILESRQQGREVDLTLRVPFELLIKVGEPGGEPKKPTRAEEKAAKEKAEEEAKSEVNKDQTEQD